MKKILQHFHADKEIWLVRLYFIACITIAVFLCKYFGNIFCDKQGVGGTVTSIALYTFFLLFIGGYVTGFFNRLKAKR